MPGYGLIFFFPKQLEAQEVSLVERTWALEVASPGFKSWNCLFLFPNHWFGWLEAESSQCLTLSTAATAQWSPGWLDRDWGDAGRGDESLRRPATNSLVMWREASFWPPGSAEVQKHLDQVGPGRGELAGSSVDLHSSVLYKELSRLASGPYLGKHGDGVPPRLTDAFHSYHHLSSVSLRLLFLDCSGGALCEEIITFSAQRWPDTSQPLQTRQSILHDQCSYLERPALLLCFLRAIV